ncbi:MAG: class C sortase [Clostridia bacterium]|nr:class C sortase [Clostridia bacterium]
MLYPVVSNYLNQRSQSKAIESYNQTAATANVAFYEETLADAQAFNHMLFERGAISLLQGEDMEKYMSLMNLRDDGVIGYVHIPKIKVNLTIGHTVEEEVLRKKAGHMPGSSFPIAGENVHAVLSAHRGLPSASLFSNLDQLEVGDTFQIHVLDRIYDYQVREINVILPEETEYLNIVPGKNYVTLMTCTPYGVNTHRMLVRGEFVSESRIGDQQPETENSLLFFLEEHKHLLLPIAAGVLLFLFLILLLPKRSGKK